MCPRRLVSGSAVIPTLPPALAAPPPAAILRASPARRHLLFYFFWVSCTPHKCSASTRCSSTPTSSSWPLRPFGDRSSTSSPTRLSPTKLTWGLAPAVLPAERGEQEQKRGAAVSGREQPEGPRLTVQFFRISDFVRMSKLEAMMERLMKPLVTKDDLKDMKTDINEV